MSSTKKRILKIVSVIVVFIIIQTMLIWALKPINNSHWVNQDIKTYRKDVDTLVFGSSHIFCGFDPDLFDKETGCVSFNLGSASQGVKDTYYYLLNCYKTFPKAKNVIVDVYFTNLIKKEHSNSEEMQKKIVLLDRLNDPLIKTHYIFDSFDIDDLPWAFFNAFYLHDKNELAIKNIKAKLDPAYRNCDPNHPYLEHPYRGRGFIPKNDEPGNSLNFPSETELNYNVDAESVKYLNKIISFCESRNMKLIFIQMPISNEARNDVFNYCSFFERQLEKIANDNKVPYENLNDSKYKFSDDLHFASSDHLNIQGAELATEYCAEIFNNYISEQ